MDANEKHTGEDCDSYSNGKVDARKPASIEDFMVLKPISRGAFGKVYLARKKCRPNSQLYAIKVMEKADMVNKNMTRQMKAERDALALSKSPFVVHLYYCLQTARKVFLVMEYLIGGDVKSLLHIYGYFDQDMSVKYISEVALALDYLHRHGIIHRDLKPDNMLISNEGHIKLTDFGLSKVKLDRELNIVDILTTPSLSKPLKNYSRTPGQVLSLICSLGFNTPGVENRRHCSASAVPIPMSCDKVDRRKSSLGSPLKKEHCFSPIRYSQKCVPKRGVFSPRALAKNLTPTLMKIRKRFETMSAVSTSDSDGGVSPLWECEEKENEPVCEKGECGKMGSPETQPGTVCPDGDGALASTDQTCREQCSAHPGDPPKDLARPAMESGNTASLSSGKRTFSEVEGSPETLPIQAKKCNAAYRRCFEIPEESMTHSGLTGNFSTVHLKDFRSSPGGSGLDEERGPKISSPLSIAKNLFCELVDPMEEVFLARDLENSSFSSSKDPALCTNLSLDSDGSMHEMSITGNSFSSTQPSLCPKNVNSTLLEDEPNKDSAHGKPTLQTPAVEAPKLSGFFRSDELASVLDRLPEPACGITRPAFFLKPRNVVAFRSYCSSINRSNVSGRSRTGSMDSMDVSGLASFNSPSAMTSFNSPSAMASFNSPSAMASFSSASATPMQSSSGSVCQTPQSMTPSHTRFRTPKSVRRGPVPVEEARILGTADYLAPELLLGKLHDFRVDWWALGVCLFEFLTGVPPFNDETPQLVFQNILNRDIPWPEGEEELSANARDAIGILLTMDMTKRADLKDLKRHPLFEGLDWESIQNQAMPFIPQPEDETDTSYFDARNHAQHLTVSGFSL